MDVVCGRCRAEYEFDDALISERGTTVRCTNCGLQFKVFPPVGQRAPEMWLVFHPKDPRVEPVRYESLRDMQKAIARGDVTAAHLLARGDETPRPLKDIVELQPLLHQPRSEPPPPPDSEPAAAPPPPRAGVKTVLGIPQRPDPEQSHEDPNEGDSSSQDVDDLAVVPGEGSEPRIPALAMKDTESKPRIRSALSMSPAHSLQKHSISETAPESSDGRGSLAPPRQSLRSTLSGGPSSSRSTLESREGSPSSSPPSSGNDRASPPPVEEKPTPEGRDTKGSSAASKVAKPVKPTISDSGEYAGQMTPTPTGMRAYGATDTQPASSLPGVHMKQEARTGGVVLAVLVGGAVFLAFANRDRLTGAVAGTTPAAQERRELEEPPAISSELVSKIQMADAAWLSSTFLQNPESSLPAPKDEELQALTDELTTAASSPSWQKVNLLRIRGHLDEARKLAGSLDKGPEQSYALALLDLAEEKKDPPWPVIIERLRDASSGERERFLARSAYIYALAASGAVARAKADFDALGQVAGGKEAPLFEELRIYLEREGAFEDLAEEPPSEEIEEPTDKGEDEAISAEEEPAKSEAAVVEDGDEKRASRPRTPKVPDAIKSQVAQADAMWRGGNQEGALVIYRKVVAEIGTDHFLGQRSAARIAQAAREKAAKQ